MGDLELLLEGVVMLSIAAVGSFLNITSIFYFARYNHQRAFHRLLMTLAVVDTSYLLFSSLSFSVKHLSKEYAATAWLFLVPFTLPLAQTSMMASVYLTISLTIERYFSVVKPFYQLRNRWLRSSLALATPGLVLSILFTLPNYFMLRTVWKGETSITALPHNFTFPEGYNESYWTEESAFLNYTTNQGELVCLFREGSELYQLKKQNQTPELEFAKFRENEIFIQVYVMWLHLIFVSILPLSLLLTMNIAIYKRLSSLPETVRRSTEGALRRRELRLARISLLIVFIFMLCHTPKIVPSTFEILGYDPRHIPVLLQVSHLLLTINSSSNFLVYYLAMGSHVKSLFCHRRRNRSERAEYHSVAIGGHSTLGGPEATRNSTLRSMRSLSTRWSNSTACNDDGSINLRRVNSCDQGILLSIHSSPARKQLLRPSAAAARYKQQHQQHMGSNTALPPKCEAVTAALEEELEAALADSTNTRFSNGGSRLAQTSV